MLCHRNAFLFCDTIIIGYHCQQAYVHVHALSNIIRYTRPLHVNCTPIIWTTTQFKIQVFKFRNYLQMWPVLSHMIAFRQAWDMVSTTADCRPRGRTSLLHEHDGATAEPDWSDPGRKGQHEHQLWRSVQQITKVYALPVDCCPFKAVYIMAPWGSSPAIGLCMHK